MGKSYNQAYKSEQSLKGLRDRDKNRNAHRDNDLKWLKKEQGQKQRAPSLPRPWSSGPTIVVRAILFTS